MLCRKGLHEKEGPGLCPLCRRATVARAIRRKRKYVQVELHAAVIAGDKMPTVYKRVAKGFWSAAMRRLALIEIGQRLKIHLRGIGFSASILIKHAKVERIRFQYLVQDGYLYLWRV